MNKKNDTLYHLKWMVLHVVIWVAIMSLIGFLIFLSELFFGVIMLIFGILGTFFNKWLYNSMIKLNTWGFKKIGIRTIEQEVKSNSYRKLYRTATFLIGLVALYFGITETLLYFGIDLKTLF